MIASVSKVMLDICLIEILLTLLEQAFQTESAKYIGVLFQVWSEFQYQAFVISTIAVSDSSQRHRFLLYPSSHHAAHAHFALTATHQ